MLDHPFLFYVFDRAAKTTHTKSPFFYLVSALSDGLVFQGGLTENLHMTHFLIAFLLTAQSFAGGQAKPTPTPSPSPTPRPIGQIIYAPVTFYTTQAERDQIKRAESKVNQTIQSRCFYDFLSNRKLIQTQGKSPSQVALQIQQLRGTVPIKMYFRSLSETSAIAFRQPPENTINLNQAKFKPSLSACIWASTMAHETMHSLLDYDHDFNWSPSRSYSVPYSVGGADQAQGGSAFDHCCK